VSDGEGGPDPRSGPKVRQPAQTESRIVGMGEAGSHTIHAPAMPTCRTCKLFNSVQGVIFIVDHRFYRVPPYICCENDRKRSCSEIFRNFCTNDYLPLYVILTANIGWYTIKTVVNDKNDTLSSVYMYFLELYGEKHSAKGNRVAINFPKGTVVR
jgi:hypothetical protein